MDERATRLLGARVLVVADDDDTRELIGLTMRSAGGVPLLASDAGTALDLVEGFSPLP